MSERDAVELLDGIGLQLGAPPAVPVRAADLLGWVRAVAELREVDRQTGLGAE
jgi:hypothetical protein